MLRAIKIRLYPTIKQELYINQLLGCYRKIYNMSLAFKKDKYDKDKINANLKDLGYEYHQVWTKNEEYSYLNNHNTKVLKQAMINMLDSYKRFFINGNGYPRFKSKHDNKQSCRFPIEAISKRNDYQSNRLTFTSQIQDIKFKCSVKYKNYLTKHKDQIKSSTLSKTKSGEYYMSILVDGDLIRQVNKPKNDIIGLDLGIKDFIVTSDNQVFENLKIKRNNQNKISKLQKELSRKQKGSSNRNKARIKLAKFHNKLNNKKENYLHQITNQLIDENQVISIEDLNVKGMMKNHCLARSIQELSIYRFKDILTYKSNWYGSDIVEVDRYYPSSKLCSNCGYKNNELTLNDREWKCTVCGKNHDRDYNAAKNIEKEGQRIIGIRYAELKPLESSSIEHSLN